MPERKQGTRQESIPKSRKELSKVCKEGSKGLDKRVFKKSNKEAGKCA